MNRQSNLSSFKFCIHTSDKSWYSISPFSFRTLYLKTFAFVDDPIIEPPFGNIPSAFPSSAVPSKT